MKLVSLRIVVPTVFAGTLLLGCHPHVELRAPEASADSQERVRAFERLHATSIHETHITEVNQYGGVTGAHRQVDYLQLADGRRVYHPEDLLPVLPEESAAYGAASRSAKIKKSARSTAAIGWTMLGVGTAGMLAAVPFAADVDATTGQIMVPLGIGAGIMLASLIPVFIAAHKNRVAMDEKSTAFEMYNDSLAMRLNVCADDRVLVPCQGRDPRPAASDESPMDEGAKGDRSPTGVAGFSFSMSPEEARSACEGAGHSWSTTSSGGNCSGTVKSVGFEAATQLVSCGGEFCEILLVASPSSQELFSETENLKDALSKNYGAPAVSESVIPPDCLDRAEECVEQHSAHSRFVWEFSTGETITLKLGAPKGRGEADAHLRLLYERPAPKQEEQRAL